MTGLAVLTQMVRQSLLRLDLFYKQISINLVILGENDGDFIYFFYFIYFFNLILFLNFT